MRLREKALIPLLKGSSILSFYLSEYSFPKTDILDSIISLSIAGGATVVGVHDVYEYMYKKKPMGEYWKTKGLKYYILGIPFFAGYTIASLAINNYEYFLRNLGRTVGFSLWYLSDRLLTKYNIEYAKNEEAPLNSSTRLS